MGLLPQAERRVLCKRLAAEVAKARRAAPRRSARNHHATPRHTTPRHTKPRHACEHMHHTTVHTCTHTNHTNQCIKCIPIPLYHYTTVPTLTRRAAGPTPSRPAAPPQRCSCGAASAVSCAATARQGHSARRTAAHLSTVRPTAPTAAPLRRWQRTRWWRPVQQRPRRLRRRALSVISPSTEGWVKGLRPAALWCCEWTLTSLLVPKPNTDFITPPNPPDPQPYS